MAACGRESREPTPRRVVVVGRLGGIPEGVEADAGRSVELFSRRTPRRALRAGPHIMLYKDDVPNVEVGVQGQQSFDPVGPYRPSVLPAVSSHRDHTGRIARSVLTPMHGCAMDVSERIPAGRSPLEIYGDPDVDWRLRCRVFWSLVGGDNRAGGVADCLKTGALRPCSTATVWPQAGRVTAVGT